MADYDDDFFDDEDKWKSYKPLSKPVTRNTERRGSFGKHSVKSNAISTKSSAKLQNRIETASSRVSHRNKPSTTVEVQHNNNHDDYSEDDFETEASDEPDETPTAPSSVKNSQILNGNGTHTSNTHTKVNRKPKEDEISMAPTNYEYEDTFEVDSVNGKAHSELGKRFYIIIF